MLEGRVGFQAVGAGTSKKVSAEMVSVGVKGPLLLTSAGGRRKSLPFFHFPVSLSWLLLALQP